MNDDPGPIMIPEWVVTFGDMMSLLLTFFIMLVAMSEIKKEAKYEAVVDSMREQFGYTTTSTSAAPGDQKARPSEFSVMSTMGRAKKKNTAKGGVEAKAPSGEEPTVRMIRPGQTTAIGSVIFFAIASAELDADAIRDLDLTASELVGKPQKIEIRGHSTAELTARTAGTDLGISLAFDRAKAVMNYMVEKHGIPANRFRLSTAGDSEPIGSGDANSRDRNSRVEVFLLDETFHGTQPETDKAAENAAVEPLEKDIANG